MVLETRWESSNCSSSLCTRWRQFLNSLNSCASRLDNSKFYYSLHLPLPDLPSWSLLLGLHRASKDFLSLQLSCSWNRMIPKVVLSRLKRTPYANISIAINGLRKKRGIFDGIANNQLRANHKLLHTKANKFCLSVKCCLSIVYHARLRSHINNSGFVFHQGF